MAETVVKKSKKTLIITINVVILVVVWLFMPSGKKSVQNPAGTQDKVNVETVKSPQTTQVDTSERLLEVNHDWMGIHIPVGYDYKYTIAKDSHILVRKNRGEALWANDDTNHVSNVQTVEWRLSKDAPSRETLTYQVYKKG
jgi:hypothetical protein